MTRIFKLCHNINNNLNKSDRGRLGLHGTLVKNIYKYSYIAESMGGHKSQQVKRLWNIFKKGFSTIRLAQHHHNSKSALSLEGMSLRQMCCDLTSVSPLLAVLFHSAGIRRYLHNLSFFNFNSEPVTEAGLGTLERELLSFSQHWHGTDTFLPYLTIVFQTQPARRFQDTPQLGYSKSSCRLCLLSQNWGERQLVPQLFVRISKTSPSFPRQVCECRNLSDH